MQEINRYPAVTFLGGIAAYSRKLLRKLRCATSPYVDVDAIYIVVGIPIGDLADGVVHFLLRHTRDNIFPLNERVHWITANTL
jgi:hypothetical protein